MKVVKASEIKLAKAVKEKIASILEPLSAWENIENPDAYLDGNAGKYVFGLEQMLRKAIELNDLEMSRILTLDLLRLSKLGKTRASLDITTTNKLRNEIDFRKVDTEKLLELTKAATENGD